MPLPPTDHDTPFDITRASHVVLLVSDPEASARFYTEVIGLVLTAREGDTVYLRGVEEACHHSLVLRASVSGAGRCARLGFRVFREPDLDALHAHFVAAGRPAEWVEVAHQGRTLHASDPAGTPLEFCATMPTRPRMLVDFASHRGAAAHRIDHMQLHVPDVDAVTAFYAGAGFRLSEYIAPADGGPLFAAFLQRKGNPHDIVFFASPGPRLHHVAFTAPDVGHIMRGCDVAGQLGFGDRVERGPGRHGPGHAQYAYIIDPDGNRVEVFTTHYQVMDFENEPKHWVTGDPGIATPWGLPARAAWHERATEFLGVPVREPATPVSPLTLEQYLAAPDGS